MNVSRFFRAFLYSLNYNTGTGYILSSALGQKQAEVVVKYCAVTTRVHLHPPYIYTQTHTYTHTHTHTHTHRHTHTDKQTHTHANTEPEDTQGLRRHHKGTLTVSCISYQSLKHSG